MSVEKIAEHITDQLNERHLFAVFDRDGTLVPMNSDPKKAILHERVRNLLKQLDGLPKSRVAILSARDLKELGEDFRELPIILAGNYGMELLTPANERWILPDAISSRSLLLQAKKDIERELPSDTGVILEDHELILCLHWHLTKSQYRAKVHSYVEKLKEKYHGLLLKILPTSYEFWPPVKWDKASGLQQMIKFLNIDLNGFLILYIGDSDSDEAAFVWVNKQNGISIRVGDSIFSEAKFTVKSPKEVENFLEILITKLQTT